MDTHISFDGNSLHRKSIRLKEHNYSTAGGYFVTICTHQRELLFGDILQGKMQTSECGNILIRHWTEIPNHHQNVLLDEFVIMPNHLHGFIIINESVGLIHESPLPQTIVERRRMLLPKIIGKFKMNSAKEINSFRRTPGEPVWQRNYYEHIIRNERDWQNIQRYIMDNPLRWSIDKENIGRE